MKKKQLGFRVETKIIFQKMNFEVLKLFYESAHYDFNYVAITFITNGNKEQ